MRTQQTMGVWVAMTAAAALLAGCAGTPERMEALEQARMEVNTLERNPLAEQAASQPLNEARQALRQADQAFEEGGDEERVTHLAYIAQRKAQVGLAFVAEAEARQRIARSEAQRNRVVLENRERELGQREQQLTAAQRAAEEAQGSARYQAEQAEAARAELMRMRQEFADLEAKQTARGMVLTLGDVLFDTARAELKTGADLTMNRLAEFMREHQEMQIMVEGHTDSVGSSQYNEELSQRRAQAVGRALEQRGVSSDRMRVMGRGEDYPVANNETAAGRQQNRRVEIVFSSLDGQFAQEGRSLN